MWWINIINFRIYVIKWAFKPSRSSSDLPSNLAAAASTSTEPSIERTSFLNIPWFTSTIIQHPTQVPWKACH